MLPGFQRAIDEDEGGINDKRAIRPRVPKRGVSMHSREEQE